MKELYQRIDADCDMMEIYEKISDITVSMKASEYLKMPELVISNYKVEMIIRLLQAIQKLL